MLSSMAITSSMFFTTLPRSRSRLNRLPTGGGADKKKGGGLKTEQIKQERKKVIEQYGAWTAHIMHLRDGLYTHEADRAELEIQSMGHGIHLRRILQAASDITNQPLNSLRVLDLACLEGLYGIEFARHGAEVVGIEGREANIAKARFAKDVLALDNLTLVQDDVRSLSAERYGHFDVVLCLGILYHLDAPDVFDFTRRLAEVCRRVTIIDTHLSSHANSSHTYEGQEYYGSTRVEHASGTAPEERLKSNWSSLDNEKSFWFTLPSLLNLLSLSGFTSAYACYNPAVPGWSEYGKTTLVAIKGQHRELISVPVLNSLPEKRWAEDSLFGVNPNPPASTGQKRNSPQRRLLRKVRSTVKRIIE